ncbi:hypothetical protein FIU90_03275 [Erythrobacter sp. THAF29]|nr:hypothetical protein FIU90_03275 [Erythrobacter sp. THAF29]
MGWVASILTRSEAPRDILRQMGIGLLATLTVGLVVNSGTFLGGLSLVALGAAVIAGAAALAGYHTLSKRRREA